MMYIAPVDGKYLCSDENYKMQEEYEKRFGERFISFNYADFQRQGDKCAGQIHLETLRQALEDNKPYQIESKRYRTINH